MRRKVNGNRLAKTHVVKLLGSPVEREPAGFPKRLREGSVGLPMVLTDSIVEFGITVDAIGNCSTFLSGS